METGVVSAQRGAPGTNVTSKFDTYQLKSSSTGKLGSFSLDKKNVLIAQGHGHPFVTLPGYINGPGTSTGYQKDDQSAKNNGITVFAIDSYNSKKTGIKRNIYSVDKNGNTQNVVHKTKGSSSTGTFSFTNFAISWLRNNK